MFEKSLKPLLDFVNPQAENSKDLCLIKNRGMSIGLFVGSIISIFAAVNYFLIYFFTSNDPSLFALAIIPIAWVSISFIFIIFSIICFNVMDDRILDSYREQVHQEILDTYGIESNFSHSKDNITFFMKKIEKK